MDVEERLKSKFLYKLVLYSVKIIPMMISGIYVLNTVLSYCGIDLEIFSYIVQFLFIGSLYLLSVTFRFCKWHRIFIHYITLILLLNIIDRWWVIPLNDRHLFLMYIIITGMFLFLALWFKIKCK